MIRNRFSRLATLAALTAFVLPNFAGQPSTYTMRLRMKQGTRTNYAMAMNMNMDMSKMPQQNNAQKLPKNVTMNMKMGYTMALQKVAAGKMTWKMVVNSASMTSNMQEQMPDMTKEMKGKTAIVVTNDRGKILSVEGDAKLGMQGMGGAQGFTGVVFPAKPIGIGSKWSETITQQNTTLTMNYKVAGLKPMGTGTAMVITATISGNQMMSTPTPITFVINTSNGEMISSVGKIKMAMMGVDTMMNFSVAKK